MLLPILFGTIVEIGLLVYLVAVLTPSEPY